MTAEDAIRSALLRVARNVAKHFVERPGGFVAFRRLVAFGGGLWLYAGLIQSGVRAAAPTPFLVPAVPLRCFLMQSTGSEQSKWLLRRTSPERELESNTRSILAPPSQKVCFRQGVSLFHFSFYEKTIVVPIK
jgi:hypothetical protein